MIEQIICAKMLKQQLKQELDAAITTYRSLCSQMLSVDDVVSNLARLIDTIQGLSMPDLTDVLGFATFNFACIGLRHSEARLHPEWIRLINSGILSQYQSQHATSTQIACIRALVVLGGSNDSSSGSINGSGDGSIQAALESVVLAAGKSDDDSLSLGFSRSSHFEDQDEWDLRLELLRLHCYLRLDLKQPALTLMAMHPHQTTESAVPLIRELEMHRFYLQYVYGDVCVHVYNTTDTRTLHLQGLVYASKGMHDTALERFARCLQIEPTHLPIPCLYNAACSLFITKNLQGLEKMARLLYDALVFSLTPFANNITGHVHAACYLDAFNLHLQCSRLLHHNSSIATGAPLSTTYSQRQHLAASRMYQQTLALGAIIVRNAIATPEFMGLFACSLKESIKCALGGSGFGGSICGNADDTVVKSVMKTLDVAINAFPDQYEWHVMQAEVFMMTRAYGPATTCMDNALICAIRSLDRAAIVTCYTYMDRVCWLLGNPAGRCDAQRKMRLYSSSLVAM